MPTTRDEVLSALKSNLKVASEYSKVDKQTQFVQWPHCTERVLKQAALDCAERCLDDEEEQGIPMLAATMAKFSISSPAEKTNTMITGVLRACVT